jgi:hypothetical protein
MEREKNIERRFGALQRSKSVGPIWLQRKLESHFPCATRPPHFSMLPPELPHMMNLEA